MTFYNTHTMNILNNLEPKINEFQKCLQQWQHRKLTLMCKVNVVKTFALPKLIYPFSTLSDPPQTVLNKVTEMLFDFIWDGKPDKIKRLQFVQSYADGGLKLTDINYFLNAFKVSWVNR